MSSLIELITSQDPQIRNTSLDDHCQRLSPDDLLKECKAL